MSDEHGGPPSDRRPPDAGPGGDEARLEDLEARLRRMGEPGAPAEDPPPAGSSGAWPHEEYSAAGRLGVGRSHVARYVAPVAFLVVVVALIAVILQSGVVGGSGDVSPSPSASASPSPVASATTYKVKRGDTLSQIAGAHGTTVEKIVALNPGLTANNLTVGERIKIPPAK